MFTHTLHDHTLYSLLSPCPQNQSVALPLYIFSLITPPPPPPHPAHGQEQAGGDQNITVHRPSLPPHGESHLHMYKKYFQGRDFVSTVTMLGGKVQSPVLQPASGRQAEAIPVARSTVYTEQYATDLGHHLLQQGALIEVFWGDHTSHVPPPVLRNEGAALEGSVISTSLVRGGALNTARMVEDSATQVVPTSLQGPQPTHSTACFTNEA